MGSRSRDSQEGSRSNSGNGSGIGIGTCGICNGPTFATADFLTTASCGHSFCRSCIQSWMRKKATANGVIPESEFAGCPKCKVILSGQDILNFGSDDPGSLRSILYRVVGQYKTQCPDKLKICPKPGCNQLIVPKDTPDPHFLYCYACRTSYCLTCTEKTDTAMEAHPDISCGDNQRRPLPTVLIHLKHIRENILTDCCKVCKTKREFHASLIEHECWQCMARFCCFCLEDIDSQSDLVDHALQKCRWYPKARGLTMDEPYLQAAVKARREDQIRRYIQELEDQTRLDVCKYLAPILEDMNMEIDNEPA